ncbi:MAG TPA: aminotransferase class I/II-fold pyridoxal phosphate-dependent enzyme [Kiritimatiellia bacterium]|jgi:aminotransferase|nr:MAG: putative N-acetyl-LL-diaminopimelate aminotransferase [Verrucomicrobia bacterium ADurb.Bin018]HOE36733.1 aminotransferase class I/II-fold pyridoxal phosphate-dependent enzyme [Kiritimatiellia bacterium]HOR74248.1 aminotransferase class I/II-fold pyridoxal phosphate-dependent enzyme [Kiritimatiellia bacterium]HOU58365.1 aminotransferase class I/II-fold pyridoxal phosphate-dependent enzyme [Kiritimatiellia bacterium]HPK68618.1 aminotransferase class I/II-fold pyridoxal phosphate-dependent
MKTRSRVAEHVRQLPFSGIRKFFDIVAQRKDVISLGVGEPDFDTPWTVREAAVFSLERGATHYTSNRGDPALRKAICRYVARQFGAEYDWESEVLVTVGVSEAIDVALRTIINPGDEVLYHEPCFVSYRPSIILAGGVPICVETRREDEFRLTRAMLEKAVTPKTRVLMLNFPCNPTGAVLAKQDVEDIAAFCVQHDLLLLTDEIYAELTYDSKHVSFVSIPAMKERTIFLHGMSKAWAMTGFRIGYACAPAEISENMMKLHQYAIMSAPTTGQKAAAEALERGDSAVADMVAEYNRRRNYLIASFAEMGVPCHTPAGAFYAFPYIGDLGISAEDFALRFLEEKGVAVVPGDAFGQCGAGFLRCAYATSMDNIREAMKRMAEFVAAVRTEKR